MKSRKIKCLMVLLCAFFIFFGNVFGLDCKYSDGKLTATFTIKESNGKIDGKAIVDGTLNSSDETDIDNEKQKVENWDKKFKPADIDMIGKDYYNNLGECPPYAVFVDRTGQFDLAVSSESHLSKFKEYGESKQGYAIMPLIESKKDPVLDGTDNNYQGGSCVEYTEPTSCENNEHFACVWNDNEYGQYCNTDNLLYVSCGDAFDIPHQVPSLISFFVNLLKIATPIILIIVAVISLLKAVAASKEDEIKKAQNSLIKKMIAAVMVFFIISIVQFVISKVADSSETGDIESCLSCFLNNDCSNSVYYKTNISGTYLCTYVNGSKTSEICRGNK